MDYIAPPLTTSGMIALANQVIQKWENRRPLRKKPSIVVVEVEPAAVAFAHALLRLLAPLTEAEIEAGARAMLKVQGYDVDEYWEFIRPSGQRIVCRDVSAALSAFLEARSHREDRK